MRGVFGLRTEITVDKLLISACLIGRNCKYSGGNNKLPEEILQKLCANYELVAVCPESDGGLSTPRDPSERVGDKVLSYRGADVTKEFTLGAELALKAAKENGCRLALLKELSPSCGSGTIYDGTFSGKHAPGYGVAAELLLKNGIRVFGESAADILIFNNDSLKVNTI